MKTINALSKTFLVTGIFSPKSLTIFFEELDNQVNSFVTEDPTKKITVTSVNDNVFFFKDGTCDCKSEHPCDFGISRVIICSIEEQK